MFCFPDHTGQCCMFSQTNSQLDPFRRHHRIDLLWMKSTWWTLTSPYFWGSKHRLITFSRDMTWTIQRNDEQESSSLFHSHKIIGQPPLSSHIFCVFILSFRSATTLLLQRRHNIAPGSGGRPRRGFPLHELCSEFRQNSIILNCHLGIALDQTTSTRNSGVNWVIRRTSKWFPLTMDTASAHDRSSNHVLARNALFPSSSTFFLSHPKFKITAEHIFPRDGLFFLFPPPFDLEPSRNTKAYLFLIGRHGYFAPY